MDDQDTPDETPGTTGRRALLLGAAGAASVLSIRPALAQATGSVMNCTIPVPDPARAGSYITADGKVVPPGTKDAFPSPGAPLRGEDVRKAMQNRSSLPGVGYDRSRAYLQYVSKLQRGQAGFTCFVSIYTLRK
jgi:hypothetical protein